MFTYRGRCIVLGAMALAAWLNLSVALRADIPTDASLSAQFSIPEPPADSPAFVAQSLHGQTSPGTTDGGDSPVPSPQAVAPAPATEQSPRLEEMPGRSSWFGSNTFRQRSPLLAMTPNMFGGFYANDYHYYGSGEGWEGDLDVPLAGGAARQSVADNNSALTQDRAYLLYNHYHNALRMDLIDADPAVGRYRRNFSVERYTLGFEKSFGGGAWSGELRLPLTNGFAADYNNGDGELRGTGGSVGNLTFILKRMLYQTDTTAISMGIGIGMPTGSDVRVDNLIHSFPLPPFIYKIHNDAVNLLPFVAVTRAPTDRLFYTAFLQVDVPTNGNVIENPWGNDVLYEETLLHVDLQGGYWLWRRPEAPRLRGLATIAEIHYTGFMNGPFGGYGDITTLLPPCDLWNVTIGLHAELADSTIARVGAAFPLSSRTSNGTGGRAFDAEVQVQLERRF